VLTVNQRFFGTLQVGDVTGNAKQADELALAVCNGVFTVVYQPV